MDDQIEVVSLLHFNMEGITRPYIAYFKFHLLSILDDYNMVLKKIVFMLSI